MASQRESLIYQQIDDILGQTMSRGPGTPPTMLTVREVLRRHLRMIVAAVIICVVAATFYLLFTVRIYRATAQLTAEPATAPQADAGSDLPLSGNFLNTQRERIASRSILALALAEPRVQSLKTFQNIPNPLAALRDGLSIDIGRTDDVISVSFDTPYAEEAPLIANAIVDAYKQYQTQPARSNADDVLALYQEQVDKLHAQLDATTAKQQAMEQQYGMLSSSGDSANINLQRLGALSQELTTAQFDALKDKSDFEEASKALPKSPAGSSRGVGEVIVSVESEDALRAELTDLESRRAELRQRYLPNHPALVALNHQIDDINRSYAAAVERRWLLAQKRQQELQASFDAQQKQIIDLSGKTAEYQRLGADADQSRKSIDNLESRMQAIQITRESTRVDIDFFNPAVMAVQSHPHSPATLSMAVLLGMMLGIGAAMLRDWMDDGLRSPDDVRLATGLRVLGSVPQMPWVTSLTAAAQKTALDPSSDAAQAYRAIRSAMDSSAPKDRCRTIVLTSPQAGDGKSTSSANLAIALAQTGRRVLLIDAVLREPMLHTVFGVSSDAGLSTLLGGQLNTTERAVRKTSVNGLWLLPAGRTPADSTELLNTPAFPELLEQLADQFDHILIDAPALSVLPDARIIAACCDLTLLVLRADTATRRASTQARDGLVGVGAHILGLILTRVPRESGELPKHPDGHRSRGLSGIDPEEDILDISATPT
jgi:capsular exopolysaccharide synthesis family protein